jgi:cobalt-zinc-cadmium efflux system membrane fusion protein
VLSNLSLTTYSLSAPISGVVTARRVQVGSGVAEGQVLYEIADLSKVWADLHVFGGDVGSIRAGAVITVERMYDDARASSQIERVLPGTATASQSTVARATLDNVDGLWRPGMAVTARIAISAHEAALAVPRLALQTMEGRDVVFVRSGETYTARPVTLGQRDARNVAIVEGLQAGEEVVTEQSYLVKADIEKSGASHEH